MFSALIAALTLQQAPTPRVLFFLLEECPIARKYAPEIQRIGKEYGKRGVSFTLAHVDPQTTSASARQFQKAFGYAMPFVLDSKHERAKAAGVTAVPSVALYVGRELRYRGRIDDRFPELGVQRKEPTRRDLRIALDEVLAGKPVSVPRTEVVGCLLPTL